MTIKIRVPDIGMTDTEVKSLKPEYSTRSPTDYVVSGPLRPKGCTNGNKGPGRVFESVDDAEKWAKEHFGKRFRWKISDAERGGRWAMLISAPDNTNGSTN